MDMRFLWGARSKADCSDYFDFQYTKMHRSVQFNIVYSANKGFSIGKNDLKVKLYVMGKLYSQHLVGLSRQEEALYETS